MDQFVPTLDRLAGDMGDRRDRAGFNYSLRHLLSPVATGSDPDSAAGFDRLAGDRSSDVRPHKKTCTCNVIEFCTGGKCQSRSVYPSQYQTRTRLATEHHNGKDLVRQY